MKPETEAVIFEAQEQVAITRVYRAKAPKMGGERKCRLCDNHEESVAHILSGCAEKMAVQYKVRRNRVLSQLVKVLANELGL